MAGNVREWSLEAYSNYARVLRGGLYFSNGDTSPGSYREGIVSPAGGSANIGFRVALYLK